MDKQKIVKIWNIVKYIITVIISAIAGGAVESSAHIISNL